MRFRSWIVFLAVFAAGCSNAGPVPKKPAPAPVAAEKDDADDPIVKEAKADTDGVLKNVLAGKTDNDSMLDHLSAKLNGFDSATIERQKLVPGELKSVRFDGTLKGRRGEAKFSLLMVEQESGKWAIATFGEPSSK